jgi:peptidoglycan-N-acetylglucosamine deacetylase
MDVLSNEGVRASFFLLGSRAEAAPEVVDREVAEGHEVACHTYAHLNAWRVWPWQAIADIRRGYESLRPWVKPNGLFRPAHGKSNIFTEYHLRRRGALTGWWTDDSGDTWPVLPEIKWLVEKIRRSRGGVILFHDFDRQSTNAQDRESYVLTATKALLGLAAEEGLHVMTLGEVMSRMGSKAG